MTDKQIINQEEAIKMIKKLNEKLKNVDNYIVELRSNFYRMKQDLDRKEQECEELSFDNFDLKDQLTDLKFKYKTINDVAKSFEQKLQTERKECERTKERLESFQKDYSKLYQVVENKGYIKQLDQLKQTLAEIKPMLEFYANSKIGEKQEDGSYKLEFTFSDIATPYCINYDPKPAREALRKINEVENES